MPHKITAHTIAITSLSMLNGNTIVSHYCSAWIELNQVHQYSRMRATQKQYDMAVITNTLFHVGTNDTAKRSFQDITKEYKEMGGKMKNLGGQVVISSLLPVKGYPQRERIIEVNNRLRRWC
ncbi:hypothetical protein JRQ81_014636 [Phrynocephalus forsythii]|uniref:Uncharacterized protein n=1 Tax=Phrynocephalus forsythii TaxID=171643 RepID=A0A9Q0XY23_9SAUR|nr:hypothetical protein JRQ81_014636 [Phrynocephalus forsythii]